MPIEIRELKIKSEIKSMSSNELENQKKQKKELLILKQKTDKEVLTLKQKITHKEYR